MSKQGEKLTKQLLVLREYIEGRMTKSSSKDLEFLQGVLDTIENINLRVQLLEREIGPNDAFIDPNEGTHRVG